MDSHEARREADEEIRAWYVENYGPQDFAERKVYLDKKCAERFEAIAPKIEGKHGTLKVKIASDPMELIEWGDAMQLSIASPHSAALRRKSSLLAGVYSGCNLLANFEVSLTDQTPRLVQLLGKNNRSLPDETRDEIAKVLVDAGVNTDRYWGKNS